MVFGSENQAYPQNIHFWEMVMFQGLVENRVPRKSDFISFPIK